MQVFKKVCIPLMAAMLISCRSSMLTPNQNTAYPVSDISDSLVNESSSFRVGVLLPLSGEASRYGQGLKKATLMALEDMNNPNLILQFYDTQSSPEGARAAVNNALRQDAEMIIGPLSGSSVEAISAQTKYKNIPVLAFSTNSDVLQPQVYSLGLLIEEQVERITTYAIKRGRKNFALLIPDNATGIAVAKAALNSTVGSDAKIVRIAFYDPKSSDFSGIIRELSDYDHRAEGINKQKEYFKKLADNGDKEAKRVLRHLNAIETDMGVDFDAVIIPESGAKLKSAVAMFGYYDVFAPDVKFLGTSVWENTRLNKESVMVGSWYPALSRSHNAYFNQKYYSLFHEYPQSLYTLAYDAVALSAVLARNKPADIDRAITGEDGYVGINGVFRILKNGRNEHSLDIMQVTATGDIVIDPAPKKFSAYIERNRPEDIASDYDLTPPLIFGKDQRTAESLVFGRILGGNYSR